MGMYARSQRNRPRFPILKKSGRFLIRFDRHKGSESEKVPMTTNQPWQDCAPGDLARLAGRARSHLVRRRILRGAAIAIPLLFVGFLFLNQRPGNSTEPNYGGIRCSAVRSHGQAYLAGSVDADTEAKIAQHLTMCPVCKAYFTKMGTHQTSRPSSSLTVERFVSTNSSIDWIAPD